MGVKGTGAYPPDWKSIADSVKIAAEWKCIRCDHVHCVETHHVLTVHHWDGNKSNNRWWNLMALCQRCHLSIQGRVDPNQSYMFEHSDWCKPYAAGLYAFRYLSKELTREQVESRLEWLLGLGEIKKTPEKSDPVA